MPLCANLTVRCPSFGLTLTTSGKGQRQLAYPQAGSGVSSLLQRNAFPAPLQRSRNNRVARQWSAAQTAEAPTVPETQAAPTPKGHNYAAFNWREHWFPVGFVRDMPIGSLTRFDIFDEAIVVVRRPDGKGPVAMLDSCPHRRAALSEGRMTADGQLQCAYHGWTFDGESGACTKIPQALEGSTPPASACGTAYPCAEAQGMVWVWPQAGAAAPPVSAIPTWPELDEPGWRAEDFVRDMPVDYTVLMENLMDPDHGLFAHQIPGFDLYTASKSDRMTVTESGLGEQYGIEARVPAGNQKLVKSGNKKAPPPPDLTGIIRFTAPCGVRWARYDPDGNTKFIASFYATPSGFGRARFFSRYIRSVGTWLKVPVWVNAIVLNNFLDQDTYLIATEQQVALRAELAAHEKRQKSSASAASGGKDAPANGAAAGNGAGTEAGKGANRLSLFCLRSPTDVLVATAARWMDAVVPLMPNRYAAGARWQPSSREQVLDRYACHTAICPASRAFHARCRAWGQGLLLAACTGAAGLFAALLLGSAQGADLPPMLTAKVAAATLLAAAGSAACKALAAQFEFMYTRSKYEKDLEKIPKVYETA